MQTWCFQIESQPVPDDQNTMDAVAMRFAEFWAQWPHAARLISRLVPERYAARDQAIHDQLRPLDAARRSGTPHPDAWRWPHLMAERQRYVLAAQLRPLRLKHYLLTWTPSHVDGDALQARLQNAFMTTATPSTLPSLLPARPMERARVLVPRQPGDPYQTVMMAYQMRGQWDLQAWHALLALPFPLTLIIDIQTPPKAGYRGMGHKVDDAEAALATINEKRRDRHARAAEQDARAANAALSRQFVHEVGYLVHFYADTERQLDQQTQAVEAATTAHFTWTRCAGVQAAQLHFLSTRQRAAIRAPLPTNPVISTLLARKTPFAIGRQATDEGLCWGMDFKTGLLHHYDPGLDRKQNGSFILLGRPKYGKTTTGWSLAIALVVLLNYKVVVLEPANRGRLIAQAMGDRAACQHVDVATDLALNIPDPLSTDPLEQRDAIVRRLSIALGKLVMRNDRQEVETRVMSDVDEVLIDRAMEHPRMYGERYHRLATMTPAEAPLLSDLVVALQDVVANAPDDHERHDGQRLVYLITNKLLRAASHVYGRHTTVPTTFDAPLTVYSFNNANAAVMPLLYDTVFGRLNRYIRRPGRTQPLVMIMDETRHMRTIRALEEALVKAFKEWRNFFAAAGLIDQDIETFLAEGSWGRYIINTAAMRLFFRMDGAGVQLVDEVFGGRLGPERIQRLSTLGQGEYIGMWEDDVHELHYDLNPHEQAILTQL